MIHAPKLPYCGLTIILANPSRFDLQSQPRKLLSATGGNYFLSDCLGSNFNRYQCDIRTRDEKIPFQPETKCLLLLGQQTFHQFFPERKEITLNEQRGHPLNYNNIPVIVSYLPQDAVDMKDYEKEFNPVLLAADNADESTDFNSIGKESATDSKRRHGKTKRKNWRFWLQKDTDKAIKITLNDGKLLNQNHDFNYHIYPSDSDVIPLLRSTKGRNLFFDIETDRELQITCLAFSVDSSNVFVLPILNTNYYHAYPNIYRIFAALGIAFGRNEVVAHNGAGFDFFVLAHKYKIGIGSKVYDTMLAQSRIYPEVEKSLGHSLSLPWIYEPYHKDEGSFAYGTQEQAIKLWKYCGKDVSSLILLKAAQQNYAKTKIGLSDSIDSVNSYIRPYLITTLQGIRYDSKVVVDIVKENDRLCNQYLRILDALVGKKFIKIIKGTGKKGTIASSSKQAVRYFHNLLKYPTGTPSKLTGQPSLAAKEMYKLKLKLKVNNPVIDFIIAYRTKAKETGLLKFNPWKKENIRMNVSNKAIIRIGFFIGISILLVCFILATNHPKAENLVLVKTTYFSYYVERSNGSNNFDAALSDVRINSVSDIEGMVSSIKRGDSNINKIIILFWGEIAK